MHSKLLIATLAAAAIALPTVAGAQGQVNSRGNSMGSQKVDNGTPKTTAPGMTDKTTGSNTGTNASSGSKVSPTDSHGDKTGEKLRGQ